MSKSTFLVNVEPPEVRIAELRDRRLFDFHLERDSRLLGDIYKGRVSDILPGMDAAFLDIGLARNALIYAGDVAGTGATLSSAGCAQSGKSPLAIDKLLRPGDELVVQVARPPVGTKGARVTAKISLPGRYALLTTNSDTVGVSRRIENEDERARLRRLADRLRPLDHGLILRTEAENVAEAEIAHDIQTLAARLQKIKANAARAPAPKLLYRDLGLLGRLVRDRINEQVDAVLIDAEEIFHDVQEAVRAQAPHLADRVRLYSEAVPLFERYGITEAVAQTGERIVPLPSGGELVIDETEALTAIDVNTSRFVGSNRLADTVLQTNLEAADEAARQIRLRDIGGVIVIDFIDMERTRDRIKVMNALEAALKFDRTRTRIVQLSVSGLVEITRRREGHSLRQMLHRPCPTCDGRGLLKTPPTVAIETRRQVRALGLQSAGLQNAGGQNAGGQNAGGQNAGGAVRVTLHPETALAFLGADAEFAQNLEAATGTRIFLRVDPTLHPEANRLEIGAPALFEAGYREMAPGTLLTVPPGAPLFPTAAPQFLALHGLLLRLHEAEAKSAANGKTNAAQSRPALVEVLETGRWFVTVRVLARGEPAGQAPRTAPPPPAGEAPPGAVSPGEAPQPAPALAGREA